MNLSKGLTTFAVTLTRILNDETVSVVDSHLEENIADRTRFETVKVLRTTKKPLSQDFKSLCLARRILKSHQYWQLIKAHNSGIKFE